MADFIFTTTAQVVSRLCMLDVELMSSVAQQMMSALKVQICGKFVPVRRTSAQGLRRVTFHMNSREYDAIEQNPEKPSRWGQLAREGHQVVQFLDKTSRRFVAVAIDGKVKEYGDRRRD